MINEKILHDMIEKNPFSKQIGMELLEVKEGYAKGRLKLDEITQNMYGGMHGGCSFALADTIAGICACSNGNYVTTVNSNMNYLLPIQDTKYVICEAKKVRHGKKIGVYQVELSSDTGDVLCIGTFTYYVLQAIE